MKRRLIAVVDMEVVQPAPSKATEYFCSPQHQCKQAKRIQEKKSLAADMAVKSVPEVVVKHLADLTTLRC